MKMPAGPPDLSLLSGSQRAIVDGTLETLTRPRFDKKEMEPVLDEMIVRFADACRTKEEIDRMAAKLDLWVRWQRKEACWLTFLFQPAALIRQPQLKLAAHLLCSDAQASFNEDLAVISLEASYHQLVQLNQKVSVEERAPFFGGDSGCLPEIDARILEGLR